MRTRGSSDFFRTKKRRHKLARKEKQQRGRRGKRLEFPFEWTHGAAVATFSVPLWCLHFHLCLPGTTTQSPQQLNSSPFLSNKLRTGVFSDHNAGFRTSSIVSPLPLCYLSSLLHSWVHFVDMPVFSKEPWTTWGEGCIITFNVEWLNALILTHLLEWITRGFYQHHQCMFSYLGITI